MTNKCWNKPKAMRAILSALFCQLISGFFIGCSEAQPTAEKLIEDNNNTKDSIPKKLSPLEFSPKPGSYLGEKTVTISSKEGGTIYFSFNGTPSLNSEIYSTPIPVYTKRWIYAFATLKGFRNSDTISGIFHVDTTPDAKWSSKITYQSILDSRDGKAYKYSRIGKQVWMSENLNYSMRGEGKCMGDLPDFCKKYGRLYTWNEAAGKLQNPDSSGRKDICPSGWRLPTKADWDSLNSFLMSTSKFKPNYAMGMFRLNANGIWKHDSLITDEYGFRALPADYLFPDGSGLTSREVGIWWSSTDSELANAWTAYISDGGTELNILARAKGYWVSVRCIQN